MAELSLQHVDKIYDNNVQAVFDFNLEVKDKEFIVFVGPSGCGKSTTLRMIAGLEEISSGELIIDGKVMNDVEPKDRDIAMVFQNYALYPHMSVYDNMAFGLKLNKTPKEEIKRRVEEAARILDITHLLDRKPKALSGGQRQRICIVKALALKPKLVICDEPVSALDVSIQAQVINLLKDLQEKHGQAYIFISHDLSVVEHISDEVGVMYLGSMVEYGSKADLFAQPLHPYTRALFSAVPIPDPDVKLNRIHLGGDIPSPANPPAGCKFHTRCPECRDICKQVSPIMRDMGGGHCVACHLYDGVTHLDPPAPGTVFAGGGNQSADSRQASETQDPLPGKPDGADSAR